MIPVGTTVRLAGDSKWSRMGLWKIAKVNPTKYKLTLLADAGVILNAPHDMVTEATEGEQKINDFFSPKRPEGLRVGVLVTYGRALRQYESGTLLVVIKDNVTDVHVVPVGGTEDGMYWKVNPSGLTVVDIKAR